MPFIYSCIDTIVSKYYNYYNVKVTLHLGDILWKRKKI
jgi:hypothetical protein